MVGFPIFTIIPNYTPPMCFGRATQKKTVIHLRAQMTMRKDTTMVVVQDTAVHCIWLRTWNLVSQTSLWQLWHFLLRRTNPSLIRFCWKLLQLSTYVPTSVFAILTLKITNISWIQFLNLCWRA